MERRDKIQGSLEKEKKKDRFSGELTDTPSETVNSNQSVNRVLTLKKFKAPLQRISEEHRLNAEKVARVHGRKTFNEVLDVYEFCYDLCDELAFRLGCNIYQLPKVLNKFIPQTPAEIIEQKVDELLDDLNIIGSDKENLRGALQFLLLSVKVHKRSSAEIIKPLFLMR